MEEGKHTISVLGIIGRALLLPFRGIVYVLDPRNCCNTGPKIKRDAAIALRASNRSTSYDLFAYRNV